jgi:predicted dienelactone hydrolase
VVFSHGFGGDRRQTTHLCSHWASHGYAVVAMDHVGNTTGDMIQAGASGGGDPREMFASFMLDRPADASFVVDQALSGAADLDVDPERVGLAGHSFGGWTTLVTTARDERIRAALPLAPAGGASPLMPEGMNPLEAAVELDWKRPVPTLFLVAEHDSLLPLPGMRELIARTPGPTRAVNLLAADHFHFCDRVEQVHDTFKIMAPMLAAGAGGEGTPDFQAILGDMKSSAELCPGDHAYALLQGLGLAHMDAHLGGDEDARDLLAGDLKSLMAARGVAVEEI